MNRLIQVRNATEEDAENLLGIYRHGIARLLYTELLAGLANRDYRNAYAGVALPNEASIQFHKSMGFESIGVFPQVGNKFGQWHDVAWLHKSLSGN